MANSLMMPLGAEQNVEEIIIKDGKIYIQFLKNLGPDKNGIKKILTKVQAPIEFVSGERLSFTIKHKNNLKGYEILRLAQKALLSLRGRN